MSLVGTLDHDTCIDKKFSVVFYLINDSAFNVIQSPPSMEYNDYRLDSLLSMMNQVFSRICVSFVKAKTIIVPDYTFNKWTPVLNGARLMQTWHTDNVINIYIPTQINGSGDPGIGGYNFGFPHTNPVVTPTDAIVWELQRLPIPLNRAHLFHSLGHFFGLPHTWEEIKPGIPVTNPPPGGVISLEYAGRDDLTNCALHGDGFCDTEADPFPAKPSNPPTNSNTNCGVYGLKDGKGELYVPPQDNYMSSYGGCFCTYSSQQYYFMAKFIMKNRLHLH